MREKIAEASMERSLGTLADYYDGLENIRADLLNQQSEFELAFAGYQISLICEEIEKVEANCDSIPAWDGLQREYERGWENACQKILKALEGDMET